MRRTAPSHPRAHARAALSLWMSICLALSMVPQAASAASATLIMDDVCDDPAAVFDHRWAQLTRQSTGLFLMRNDRSVAHVSGNPAQLSGYDRITVVAHGGPDEIGSRGVTYNQFANGLRAAHPAAPDEVFFVTCFAGKGPDSLLKRVNAGYAGAVRRLTGGVSACRLVGNGDPSLANASYRINVTESDPPQSARIQANIMARWDARYPHQPQGSDASYAQFCNAIVGAAPGQFDPNRLSAFMTQVYTDFTQVSQPPSNYLDLVRLNTGGDAPTVCGADPGGTGRVECP